MDDFVRPLLTPPPRRRPERASFDVRRRALRHWLADLPLADPAATGQLLQQALAEINRLALRPRLRLRVLETLRQPVFASVTAQGRLCYGKELLRSAQSQHLALRMEQMLLELSIGYNSLLDTAQARRWHGLPLQRTLHALGWLLFHHASLYRAAPPGLWAHLHRLFIQAESQGLAYRLLPDPLGQRQRRSIAATYRHSLLFAAAGPHQMRPPMLAAAYTTAERWASHTRLYGRRAGVAPEGAFLVDMASDAPPRRPHLPYPQSGKLYLLDAAPVVALAQRQLQPRARWQFWRSAQQPAANRALLQHVVETLGLPPLRQSVRLPVQASMAVLVGLPQAHRGLAASHRLTSLAADPAKPRFAGRDIPQPNRTEQMDIWGLIHPAELLRRNAPAMQPSIQPRPKLPSEHSESWQLLNSSAGGYCLHADLAQSSRVQVGELLALRESGKQNAIWQLGIVRWMQRLSDDLQIGVQALGFRPTPGLLRLGHLETPVRSLLLPADTINRRPASLLTLPLALAPQQRAVLSGATGEQEILLSRLLESGNGFMWFEYQLLRSSTANRAAERRVSTALSSGG